VALFGIALILLGQGSTTRHFYLMFGLIAAVGAGANSLSYMRAICTWFDRQRGIAIGIAQSGMGVGVMMMPYLTSRLLERGDWQFVYQTLGAIVLVVALPIVAVLVSEKRQEPASPRSQYARPDDAGLSVTSALRSARFWALFAAFLLLGGAINATALHLVPLIESNGISREAALMAASVFGVAMLIGRLATGYLVDRFFAPHVAAALIAASGAGTGLLAMGVPATVSIAAAFITGIGAGADSDLNSYLTSRYFGLRSFAALSGYLFSAYLVGTSLVPWLVGLMVDRYHSYTAPMLGCALLAGGAAALMFTLGPYSPAAERAAPEPARGAQDA
jgi:fucose permease